MDDEQRIRDRAYHLWLDEGQPEGRADAHWGLARELVAIEENQAGTLSRPQPTGPQGEPVEPMLAVENAGDLPSLTDEGERTAAPR